MILVLYNYELTGGYTLHIEGVGLEAISGMFKQNTYYKYIHNFTLVLSVYVQ